MIRIKEIHSPSLPFTDSSSFRITNHHYHQLCVFYLVYVQIAGLCLGVSVLATLTTACVAIAFGVGMLIGGLFMRCISSSACRSPQSSREKESHDGEEVELEGPPDGDGVGPVMVMEEEEEEEEEGRVTTPTHDEGGGAAVFGAPAVYEEILALQSADGDNATTTLRQNLAYENPMALSRNPAYEKTPKK